jgi:hypothetical protein
MESFVFYQAVGLLLLLAAVRMIARLGSSSSLSVIDRILIPIVTTAGALIVFRMLYRSLLW